MPRTASAQSKDFATLFYIKHEDFLELLSENPEDYVISLEILTFHILFRRNIA